MNRAVEDVLTERRKQIAQGWTPEHDDGHKDEWIASAAAEMMLPGQHPVPHTWAWKHKHPDSPDRKSRRGQLVIATAMGLAEIERIDRAAGWGRGLRRPKQRTKSYNAEMEQLHGPDLSRER